MTIVMQAGRPVRLLVFGAALHEGSLNRRLAALAGDVIEWHSGEALRARMEDFECPLYDDDLAARGAPDGAQRFREQLADSDGMVVAAPEYNGSMSGVLKNLIDWTSRYFPHPFDGRHALLLSASPAAMGGNAGLWALRVPLEHLGMRVYPEMFSLGRAGGAFDREGHLRDAELATRLERLVESFMMVVDATKFYSDLLVRARSQLVSMVEDNSAYVPQSVERVGQHFKRLTRQRR